MQEFTDNSNPREICLPNSIASKFPFLLRQVGKDVTFVPQSNLNNSESNEESETSCWSPSPLSSPVNTTDVCSVVEDFQFPVCAKRSRDNLNFWDDEDEEFPESKSQRIGW